MASPVPDNNYGAPKGRAIRCYLFGGGLSVTPRLSRGTHPYLSS